MNIHLVSFSGYEWDDPVHAFGKKEDAEALAEKLNKKPRRKDKPLAAMSEYVVRPVPYTP